MHILLLAGQTTEWSNVIALSADPLNSWLLIWLSDFTDTLNHLFQDEVSVAHVGVAHLVTKLFVRGLNNIHEVDFFLDPKLVLVLIVVRVIGVLINRHLLLNESLDLLKPVLGVLSHFVNS